MSGLLEKDICLLLRGHRNMLILFFMICVFLGLGPVSYTHLDVYKRQVQRELPF